MRVPGRAHWILTLAVPPALFPGHRLLFRCLQSNLLADCLKIDTEVNIYFMGKTHFWRRPTELPSDRFAAAAKEIRRVVGLAGVPLAGFEGHGEPLFMDDAVVFNGVGSAHCEPFQIRDTEFDRHGRPETFSFCKTEGLPYDLAVKAALVIFKEHLGDLIKVMSDEPDSAWSDARDLVMTHGAGGKRFKLDPDR